MTRRPHSAEGVPDFSITDSFHGINHGTTCAKRCVPGFNCDLGVAPVQRQLLERRYGHFFHLPHSLHQLVNIPVLVDTQYINQRCGWRIIDPCQRLESRRPQDPDFPAKDFQSVRVLWRLLHDLFPQQEVVHLVRHETVLTTQGMCDHCSRSYRGGPRELFQRLRVLQAALVANEIPLFQTPTACGQVADLLECGLRAHPPLVNQASRAPGLALNASTQGVLLTFKQGAVHTHQLLDTLETSGIDGVVQWERPKVILKMRVSTVFKQRFHNLRASLLARHVKSRPAEIVNTIDLAMWTEQTDAFQRLRRGLIQCQMKRGEKFFPARSERLPKHTLNDNRILDVQNDFHHFGQTTEQGHVEWRPPTPVCHFTHGGRCSE
mmetsp:Transcript_51859/g.138311  ORF Transcript_51859/g.138311 Transcript_51859/m.138311 type:complete len:378 (+) Transcript_51859:1360-2493(+)